MPRTRDWSPWFVSPPRRSRMASPPRRPHNEQEEDVYAHEQTQQLANVLKRAAKVAVPQSPRLEAIGFAQEDAEGDNAGSTAKPSGMTNAVRRGGEAERQGLSDHGEAGAERGGASGEDIVTVVFQNTEPQPICPPTHATKHCKDDCINSVNYKNMLEAAQNAEDTQAGYACAYQNKRAARSCNEVKEAIKGQRTL